MAVELSNDENINDLIPSVSLNIQKKEDEETNDLVTDEALLSMMSEVACYVRKDREEIDDVMSKFADMVFNEGDPSNSSKEALVNLVKIKSDSADKLTKLLELMTRIKLRDRTFPNSVSQTNTINIGKTKQSKRALLDVINKAKKKKVEEINEQV